MSDTIFATATAPGRAAVAVVRISGPESCNLLKRLSGRISRPRMATLMSLHDAHGDKIDQALVIRFVGPCSYTGEDCVELHLHGGVAIVEATISALLEFGARLAAPGEFTRRAIENGKLDLGQAEAIGDLIDAETRAQARQALGQLGGALGRRYEGWRDLFVEALAYLEAGVDFPDEDVPAQVTLAARRSLEILEQEIGSALDDQARGRRVREGYRVAIIGATNAGKSSLLNVLAARDAAIVTPVAGATRDIIEVSQVLAGYKILLADMAGIRATEDPVEAEGVRRALAWAQSADLRLWVVDGSRGDGSWRLASSLVGFGDICILNKSDLPLGKDGVDARVHAASVGADVITECLLSSRSTSVFDHLTPRVVLDLSGSEFPAATRVRHAKLLGEARDHLARALHALADPELAAEDVRLAARALARITGKVDAEDVLDRVFATFCIGK
jgi:tRNA modification GTPase